jgi:hypothetical protein
VVVSRPLQVIDPFDQNENDIFLMIFDEKSQKRQVIDTSDQSENDLFMVIFGHGKSPKLPEPEVAVSR